MSFSWKLYSTFGVRKDVINLYSGWKSWSKNFHVEKYLARWKIFGHQFNHCEAERRETLSTCIYGNRRQRIKSIKMVVETLDEKQFSYIYVLNTSLKCPGPTHHWRYLTPYFSESTKDRDVTFDTILIQVIKLFYHNFELILLIVWKLCAFRHRRNFDNIFCHKQLLGE